MPFSLEPRHQANKGDGWLLFHIWLQRFAYRQVFSIVIFKTIKRAIDGRPFSWDKLDRTAKMSAATERITALRHIASGIDCMAPAIALEPEPQRLHPNPPCGRGLTHPVRRGRLLIRYPREKTEAQASE